ncbi:MAG: sigma-70 family RNA polymerase sigma factor [Proteobacteria bacterium]|nr:sigma-70 family RNA polymerase sigma factor [Pseudomonadota bacterium]
MGQASFSSERQQRLADLLSRVALGDRVAFEALYKETCAHLLGVILRIQADRTLAEDVLQEAYVNIWRAAPSFNPGLSQASTWLGSVARNRAIDSLRRRQSEPSTVSRYQSVGEEEDETDLLAHVPSEAPGPMDLLAQASEERALRNCMAHLSGDQQRSLALAYFEGLTHVEVAEKMGQPLGTVKSWVRRALQGLKNCLERASLAMN